MISSNGKIGIGPSAADLLSDPFLDFQGKRWPHSNRSELIRRTARLLSPLEIKNLVADKSEIQPNLGLIKFSRFVGLPSLDCHHSQIRNSICAVGQNHVFFVTQSGLSMVDLALGQEKKIIGGRVIESVRADRNSGLIAGVGNSDKLFLFCLKTNSFLIDDECSFVYNRHVFCHSSPTLLSATNNSQLVLRDLSTLSHLASHRSLAPINDLSQHSQNPSLIALAMDLPPIQLIDTRSLTTPFIFKGHEAANFSVKLYGDWGLASGGEDGVTRIWDLRKGDRALKEIQSEIAAIRQIEVDEKRGAIYILESVAFLSVYKLEGEKRKNEPTRVEGNESKEAEKDRVSFFGCGSGLAFSPNKEKVFLGTAKAIPGLLCFSPIECMS